MLRDASMEDTRKSHEEKTVRANGCPPDTFRMPSLAPLIASLTAQTKLTR